jgi:predicted RNA-binding protein with PIN domain
MSDRLIIVDGYNVIHRSPHFRPGEGRSLRDSRDKLVNLLSWTVGGEAVRIVVVFDGAESSGRDERSGRVEVRYSRPPDKADDVIRRMVEEEVERVAQVTVVTADLEVARHARAMGATVALSDLFVASAVGPVKAPEGADDKPATLTRAELEQWKEIFQRQRPAGDDDETSH